MSSSKILTQIEIWLYLVRQWTAFGYFSHYVIPMTFACNRYLTTVRNHALKSPGRKLEPMFAYALVYARLYARYTFRRRDTLRRERSIDTALSTRDGDDNNAAIIEHSPSASRRTPKHLAH